MSWGGHAFRNVNNPKWVPLESDNRAANAARSRAAYHGGTWRDNFPLRRRYRRMWDPTTGQPLNKYAAKPFRDYTKGLTYRFWRKYNSTHGRSLRHILRDEAYGQGKWQSRQRAGMSHKRWGGY